MSQSTFYIAPLGEDARRNLMVTVTERPSRLAPLLMCPLYIPRLLEEYTTKAESSRGDLSATDFFRPMKRRDKQRRLSGKKEVRKVTL